MTKLKIGVFGAGRGMDLATNFMLLGCDIVALCDSRTEMLAQFAPQLSEGGKTYTDFDSFIQHEMDAIILANNFHEHTPYAIRCLEKGIHVFCECISNGTMAEGEYNHPTARDDVWFLKTYRYHTEHWRSYLPATYYITHSLGPIMRATGATPRRVTAFSIFAPTASARTTATTAPS